MARLAALRTRGSDQGDLGSHWVPMYTSQCTGLFGWTQPEILVFLQVLIENPLHEGADIHLAPPDHGQPGSGLGYSIKLHSLNVGDFSPVFLESLTHQSSPRAQIPQTYTARIQWDVF